MVVHDQECGSLVASHFIPKEYQVKLRTEQVLSLLNQRALEFEASFDENDHFQTNKAPCGKATSKLIDTGNGSFFK
jgi:hypothetical protein